MIQKAEELKKYLDEAGIKAINTRIEYLKQERYIDALYWTPRQIRHLAKHCGNGKKNDIVAIYTFVTISNFLIHPLIMATFRSRSYYDAEAKVATELGRQLQDHGKIEDMFKKEEHELKKTPKQLARGDRLELGVLKKCSKLKKNDET